SSHRPWLRLSLILPTISRPSLQPLLSHLQTEIGSRDEVLIVGDGPQPLARALAGGLDRRFRYFEHGPTGHKGNEQRQLAISKATGNFLVFIDDDDDFVPG